MDNKQVKVGNVIVDFPESGDIPLGNRSPSENLVAGRGDEVKPLESLPNVPNPNDFVGSSLFHVHAMGKVETADRRWIKITGFVVLAIWLVAPFEFAFLSAWVNSGKWVPFVVFNVALVAFLRWRANAKRRLKRSG